MYLKQIMIKKIIKTCFSYVEHEDRGISPASYPLRAALMYSKYTSINIDDEGDMVMTLTKQKINLTTMTILW